MLSHSDAIHLTQSTNNYQCCDYIGAIRTSFRLQTIIIAMLFTFRSLLLARSFVLLLDCLFAPLRSRGEQQFSGRYHQ